MIKWGIFPRVLSALLRYHVYELFSCNDTVLIIKEERTILCTSICYSFISSFFFEKYEFLVLRLPLAYVMHTLDIDILLILLCCLLILCEWM